MLYNDLINRLVEIRKQQGIKQKVMAKKIFCSNVSMSQYESGNRSMPGELMMRYANQLGYELKLMVK